jgi:hypothetical protein
VKKWVSNGNKTKSGKKEFLASPPYPAPSVGPTAPHRVLLQKLEPGILFMIRFRLGLFYKKSQNGSLIYDHHFSRSTFSQTLRFYKLEINL